MCVCVCVRACVCGCIYTLFPFLRFTFLEISIAFDLQKKPICFKIYFITNIKCYYKLHLH